MEDVSQLMLTAVALPGGRLLGADAGTSSISQLVRNTAVKRPMVLYNI